MLQKSAGKPSTAEPMKKSNDILLPEFDRLIKDGHTVEFTPQGVSMRPTIEGERDSVLLRQPKLLKVGHIVLAKIGQQYVLHRIIKIQNEHITLQGDGNLRGEEQCTENDIIGQVVRIKDKVGKQKRLTRGQVWRHTPTPIKWLVLKLYRKYIQLQERFNYEN